MIRHLEWSITDVAYVLRQPTWARRHDVQRMRCSLWSTSLTEALADTVPRRRP
jgi:hypothetical protein